MTSSVPEIPPSDAALQQAISHHQAGRLSDAEQLYLAVLQSEPGQAIANHNLGLLLGQIGEHAAALPYLKAALEADPDEGQFWLSCADALLANGQASDALDTLRRALQRGLDTPAAHALLEEAEAAVSKAPAASHAPSPADIAQLVELFNGGRHAELESRVRLLIEQYPDSGFAWSVLGTALQLQGKDALPAYRKTAQLSPNDSEAHCNLGNALQASGQYDAAVASYCRALEINPAFAQVQSNLGSALQALGRLEEAVASYQRALSLAPDHAAAHFNLANAFKARGRFDDAVTSYRRALQLEPGDAEAHSNLGDALHELGQFDAAVSSYRRALEIRPDCAEAHLILANTLHRIGQTEDAVAGYRRALEMKPDFAPAHKDLGNALQTIGRLDDAVASYRRALAISPADAAVHRSLGAALSSLGQFDGASASYQKALEIDPDHAAAHSDLGVVRQALGQLDGAVASYRRALEINSELTLAHVNLASALQMLGHNADSQASCRRALEIDPDSVLAHSNLLFGLSHTETLDAQALFAQHCLFADQFEARLRPDWPQHANARDPERCLQIGFVSGDLRNHAVANFIEPVLAQLASHQRLSLHGYSNDANEDSVTRRLQGYLAHWHPIAGLSDAALAQKIRADGIDILIDLSGHTSKHRLLAFARKPAPVQASWIGYPGTTGLQAMDYYLCDRFLLPPGQFDHQFTEKLVFLPANAPFLPSPDAPPVNDLPALANGYLTFGSFNRPGKLSRAVIAVWSQLLRALPTARMLLAAMPEDGNNATMIDWFAQEGISADRLSLRRRCDNHTYLALHHLVDVCLDTFPYTGGTTTLNALWMGVPTLTIAGQTVAGRSGAAILGHTGLQAFVARDAADFVQRGLFISRNLPLIADLRAGMRQRLEQTPVGQPAVIADGLDRALRIMWQRWCAGLPAQSFEACPQHLGDVMQEAVK